MAYSRRYGRPPGRTRARDTKPPAQPCDVDVWAKQLADGSRAVALLNRGASTARMTVRWRDLGYPDSVSASVRDLWEKKDLGKMTGSFSADVPSHGVVMVRVTP